MSSSRGNKGRCVGEFNISIVEPPCKCVRLMYMLDTDEVISEAESKYREHEPLFNSYKQLNDEISLEWFCNPELIKSYEYWDCKNLDKYKPSKAEQKKIKIAGKRMKQNKTLIKSGYLKKVHPCAKTIPEIGKLAGIDINKTKLSRSLLEQLQLDQKSARNLINPNQIEILKKSGLYKEVERLNKSAYFKSLSEQSQPEVGSIRWELLQQKKRIQAYQNTFEYKSAKRMAEKYKPLIGNLRNAKNLPNSLITDTYISTAETAFKALGGRSSLRGMIDSIQPYQSEVDRILKSGIDAQTAWNMLEPHRGVTENLQFRLRAYEQEEQPKETKKQLRKIIESKEEEIAELKALLATQEKQDKKIEKQTRTHQLHVLIAKVDNELTKLSDGIRPQAQIVWNTIEENYYDYDDEAIIQEVKDNTIFWKSKRGIDQTLSLTSFSATLSTIRKKDKKN